MKFTIDKNVFADAIKIVKHATANVATIPVLQGILVEADKSGVYLTASNGNISITHHIPVSLKKGDKQVDVVEMEREGRVVLPEKYFVSIVSKLRGKQIVVETDDKHLTYLRSDKSKYDLKGTEAEEFPRLPSIERETCFSMDCDLLKSIIKTTIFGIANNETRPILTGVHWKYENDMLKCTATDSHRLAQREVLLDSACDSFESVIPGKNLNQFLKILPEDSKSAEICFSNTQMMIKFDRTTFYSKLLEGTFPDTSRIIPNSSQFSTKLVMNRTELLEAVDSCSIFKDDHATPLKLIYKGENNEIQLLCQSDVGRGEESLFYKKGDGNDIKIAFNPRYMLEALRGLDGSDNVIVAFTGEMSPFVLQGDNSKGNMNLILPVRTKD